MSLRNKILRGLVLTCATPLLLGGCVPLILGGAAATGGYAAAQERGVDGTASDTGIKSSINAHWARSSTHVSSYVDLNIYEGRVLLTGNVPNPQIREEAIAGVRSVKGVVEIIDQIHIANAATFSTAAGDNWILTRLRSALTFDGQVHSLNYSLQVVDGIVYILGSASSRTEMQAVLDDARTIPNVRQVVNYIRIRVGVGGDANPAPNAGPAPVTDGNATPGYAPPPPPPAAPAYSQPNYSQQPSYNQNGYAPSSSTPSYGGGGSGYNSGSGYTPPSGGTESHDFGGTGGDNGGVQATPLN